MAFHYLIDGYNLLFGLPRFPEGTWPEKREKLLAFLKHQRPQGRNHLSVIFDSRQGWGDEIQADGLTVIFTAGETADERIAAMVRKHPRPRSLVVVSSDQGIRDLVRGTGARFETVPEFLKQALTHSPRPGGTSEPEPPTAREITEELMKKWL